MGMLTTISTVASLVGFVLCILIAIPMFKKGMIWQGILSIICGLFALIYGWMKKDELGVEKLVLGLGGCILVSIVCNVIVATTK